jgi:NACalpha-BTF3-like transcription factor
LVDPDIKGVEKMKVTVTKETYQAIGKLQEKLDNAYQALRATDFQSEEARAKLTAVQEDIALFLKEKGLPEDFLA